MPEWVSRPEQTHVLSELAAAKAPKCFLIKGAAGVGKSTFARTVMAQKTDIYWLAASFLDGQETALAPVVQLLRQLKMIDGQLFEKSLDLSALGYILPDLPTPEKPPQKEILFEAVIKTFRLFSQKLNAGILLENIHWSDSASLDLLDYLLHLQRPLPCPFLITLRTGETSLPKTLRHKLGYWQRLSRVKEIKLGAFDERQTYRLLTQILGNNPQTDFCRMIAAKTGGNPLFIKEILAILKENQQLTASPAGWTSASGDAAFPIPGSLANLIEIRIGRLSPNARQALEIAAGVGFSFNLFQLAKWVADDKAIDELLESGIIIETKADRASFQHQLIRETIYQRIPWSKRRKINSLLAKWMEEKGGNPEKLAQYWQRAGDDVKARKHWIQAGQNFCRLFAHENAVHAASQALKNWPPGEDETTRLSVLEMMANCNRLRGEMHGAIQNYRSMLENKILQADKLRLAQTHRSLASCYALQGSWSYFRKNKEIAAKLFLSLGRSIEASEDYREIANRNIDDLQFMKALEAAQKAWEIARATEDVASFAKSASLLAYVKSMTGSKEEAIILANKAIAAALSANHFEAAAYAYRKLAGVLEYASDYAESVKAYESALQFCETRQMDVQSLLCMSCMSWVLFRYGDWSRALEVSYQVAEDAKINDASKATAHMVVGLIRIYRGELKTAGRHLERSRFLIEKEHFRMISFLTAWGEAILAEFEGAFLRAANAYQKILEEWKESDDRHDVLPVLVAACHFFRRYERKKELNETMQITSQIASQVNNPEALGTFSFALGQIMLQMDKPREAVNHFEKTVEYFSRLDAPLQLLYAKVNLGESLLLTGKLAKGANLIRQIIDEARNMGLRPFVADWEAILEQYALQKKAELPQLTERQLEVLRALAKGLANKEIAAKLNLSTRTVDMHVRNILDRLNCRSRTEAVRIATERGFA